MFNICVVDDDDTTRNFIVLALEQFDFDVVDYDSGKKFIANYDRESFDLVITDIHMEDVTGLDVLNYMKATNPLIPIIIISGEGGYEENGIVNNNLLKEITKNMGAETFINKPIDSKKLVALIKRTLSI